MHILSVPPGLIVLWELFNWLYSVIYQVYDVGAERPKEGWHKNSKRSACLTKICGVEFHALQIDAETCHINGKLGNQNQCDKQPQQMLVWNEKVHIFL